MLRRGVRVSGTGAALAAQRRAKATARVGAVAGSVAATPMPQLKTRCAMLKTVIAIVPSEAQAQDVIEKLRNAGIIDATLSVLRSTPSGSAGLVHVASTKAPEGATAGALSGGALGGTLGVLAGIGLLAVPGVGPFLAAGPILAALSGAALGAALGGAGGALVGLGIPEIEAEAFAAKLDRGDILVAVHGLDTTHLNHTLDTLRDVRDIEMRVVSERGADQPAAVVIHPAV